MLNLGKKNIFIYFKFSYSGCMTAQLPVKVALNNHNGLSIKGVKPFGDQSVMKDVNTRLG